jgi:tetratricopeptide (TPR) repeat protein
VALLRSALLVLPLVALATPLSAQTVQQDYEAAQQALDAKDIAAARARFEALLKRLPPNSKGRSMGVVKARLGATLVMDGEQEAAIPLLTEAMAIFGKDTPADVSERAEALTDRARAHEALGQFTLAAADYHAAHDLLKPEPGSNANILLQSGLGRSLVWTNPDEARRVLDGLIALPDETWGKDKRGIALIHSLRGRVELNDDKPLAAMRFFREALSLAGGGTTVKADLTDVRVRADAAIAAYLLGRKDDHQKFVAFSGGGSLVTQGLSSAQAIALPSCGGASGLSPDDVAVVEFAIHPDGRVRTVQPIFVKRADGKRPNGDGSGPETQFVQALRDWYWKPGGLEKVNPFWRQALRVEVRCTNTRMPSRLESRSVAVDVQERLLPLGIRPMPDMTDSDAARLPLEKAELEARLKTDGPESVQLVAPLRRLAYNNAAATDARIGWMQRAMALLQQANADPGVLAYMRDGLLQLQTLEERDGLRLYRVALAPLLAEESAARPYARTTQMLRLNQAAALQETGAPAEAQAVLEAVIGTPEAQLGRVDPIRTSALLRLSNIAAARNDTAAAAKALAATGLTPEQCALVDVRPKMENRKVASSIFPEDARRWGSGGMTTVEYDIGTDGTPVNARTVMAAPPFVFGEATQKGAMALRYQPVFRPGNAVGCTGETQNFRFMVGDAPPQS